MFSLNQPVIPSFTSPIHIPVSSSIFLASSVLLSQGFLMFSLNQPVTPSFTLPTQPDTASLASFHFSSNGSISFWKGLIIILFSIVAIKSATSPSANCASFGANLFHIAVIISEDVDIPVVNMLALALLSPMIISATSSDLLYCFLPHSLTASIFSLPHFLTLSTFSLPHLLSLLNLSPVQSHALFRFSLPSSIAFLPISFHDLPLFSSLFTYSLVLLYK